MKGFGGRCFYCNVPLTIPVPVPVGASQGHCGTDFSVDHFVPLAMGGENKFSNYVASCRDCNRRKGNGPPFVPVTWSWDVTGKLDEITENYNERRTIA